MTVPLLTSAPGGLNMKTLLVMLMLAVCLLSVSATSQRPEYEYKVENGVSEGKINSLASQGWEVVTASNYNGGMPYVILRRSK